MKASIFFPSSADSFSGPEFPFTILTNNSASNKNAVIINITMEIQPNLHLNYKYGSYSDYQLWSIVLKCIKHMMKKASDVHRSARPNNKFCRLSGYGLQTK